MIIGALPYREGPLKRATLNVSDRYYITIRSKNRNTKYFLNGFTQDNKVLLTSDKREAQVFEDIEATALCARLRVKYKTYAIGKMPTH